MTRLAVIGLTAGYQRRPVIHDIELSVQAGEVVGLIGPNGAGKTTLLHGLAGLRPLLRGGVYVDGLHVSGLPARARARLIALVPQGEALAWPLTVRELVALGRAPQRGWLWPLSAGDHALVRQALTRAELADFGERRMDRLSSGERQRALIARALAQGPRLLLLDEPTANLDVRHQLRLLRLVRQLAAEQGLAVMVTLHDLAQAARYCDRLVLLRAGRVHAEGTAPQVFTPDNLRAVFGVGGELYRDPSGQWTLTLSEPGGPDD